MAWNTGVTGPLHVSSYDDLRKHLIAALERVGLQVRAEEIIYVRDGARECEIYAYPDLENQLIWGKISFEWTAHNQALWEDVDEALENGDTLSGLDPRSTEIPLHASFHLDLTAAWLSTEMIRDIAQDIVTRAAEYFADEGSVVAEVSLSPLLAKVEGIRYQADAVAHFVSEDEWWTGWGEAFAAVLGILAQVNRRLEEGGPGNLN